MAKFEAPPPPAELGRVRPLYRELPAGCRLCRVYFAGGQHPASWSDLRWHGPTNARLDHHLPDPEGTLRRQDRGVFYAATTFRAALAEVFQDTATIDLRARHPHLAVFQLARPLRTLDLSGLWPTRTRRASAAIASGDRGLARAWSRAIYAAHPDVEGLWYRSAMDPKAFCVALYERGAACLPAAPEVNRPLASPALFADLRRQAAELGYALLP
ncbi:MAG: RES family NAD+ phosphorylase [Deferrisomatales bacterium]